MNKNTGDGEIHKALNPLKLTHPNDNDISNLYELELLGVKLKGIPEVITNIRNLLAQEANKAQQELLQELMEQKRGLWTDKASDGNEYRLWAVPISVIQNKLEGLS